MEKLYDYLPRELVTFLLVTVFSLLIGLSQRKISLKREGETTLFGTDRTAINIENQCFTKQTPDFTPKNVKSGVFCII